MYFALQMTAVRFLIDPEKEVQTDRGKKCNEFVPEENVSGVSVRDVPIFEVRRP